MPTVRRPATETPNAITNDAKRKAECGLGKQWEDDADVHQASSHTCRANGGSHVQRSEPIAR